LRKIETEKRDHDRGENGGEIEKEKRGRRNGREAKKLVLTDLRSAKGEGK